MSGEMREGFKLFFEQQFHFRPRKPHRLLSDGEIIDLAGGEQVEIIHTPGHTPGHLAFHFKKTGILFLGDYDLTPFGPWYGDTLSSIEDTLASISRLQSIPASIWLTCHEAGIFENPPGEKWGAYAGVIDQRDQKLLDFLDAPKTLAEIARAWIVYGKPRQPAEFFLFGERAIMEKHVDRLLRRGRIARQGERLARL